MMAEKGETDPRTARLLAKRMVVSCFDGLDDSDLGSIIAGAGDAAHSPAFSMLSYTFDVFSESVSLPEQQLRQIFGEAVQEKLAELRKTYSGSGG